MGYHRSLVMGWVVAAAPFPLRVWSYGDRARSGGLLVAAGVAAWVAAVAIATDRRRPRRALVPLVAVLAVLGLGLLVASTPSIGGTPAALAAARTVLVCSMAVALPRSRGASGAAPMALLVASGLAWFRWGSRGLEVAALTAAVLAVVAAWVSPTRSRAVERGLARVTGALGRAAFSAVVLLVLLPTLYLAGFVARPWRGRRAASGWRTRQVDPTAERRDARRPYAPVAPSARAVWVQVVGVGLTATVLVAVLVERQLDTAAPSSTSSPATTISPRDRLRLSETVAFEGVPWADALSAEQDRFSPLYGAAEVGDNSAVTFDGRYIDVVDGVRREREPRCRCPRVRVWWFGGSAAFGWDQRGGRTIASSLVREAERDGIGLEVRTYAAPGVTAWEQYRVLSTQLDAASDEALPDLVVFYDGFNDLTASLVDAAAGTPIDPSTPAILDQDKFMAFQRHPGSFEPLGGPEVVGRAAARRYLATAAEIRDAAAARGVPVRMIRQADAFTSRRRLEEVRRSTLTPPDVVQRSEFAVALLAAEQEMAAQVIDLRRVLDDADEPVFADPVHNNEPGARLVAVAVYRSLREQLRELAR